MAFIKVLEFVVFKILHNLVFVKNLCLQITVDVSKILKSAKGDVVFILNVLSETVNIFCVNLLSSWKKSIVNIIKMPFY